MASHNARAITAAEGKRSSGFLAKARKIAASSAAGTGCGATEEGTGGGSERCACINSNMPLCSNGRRPVTMVKSMPPTA
jgi:hypothetical protein